MAGSVTPITINHKPRGVVRTEVSVTCDASGDATAAVVGVGFGKLVGVILDPGTLDFSNTILTVKDSKSGKAILTFDTLASATAKKFSSTTTGEDDTELFTAGAAHGLKVNDSIVFLTKTGGTLPTIGTTYYVRAVASSTTFEVSATAPDAVTGQPDATAIDLGSDVTASTWVKTTRERAFPGTTTGDSTGGVTEDLFTASAAHNLSIGSAIKFISKTGGSLITVGTTYYVIAEGFASTTFELSTTPNGSRLEIGTDVSAAVWKEIGLAVSNASLFRPTTNITTNTGAAGAVTAADTAVDVNRDIFLGGKVTVEAAQGGNLGAGTFVLIVDEANLDGK